MQKRALEIPGFQKRLLQVRGVDISYWIGGHPEGHPVLLWHGFLGTSFSWHKVMPLLAEAGCYVLAPDMRGFGDSAKPEGTRATTATPWLTIFARWWDKSILALAGL